MKQFFRFFRGELNGFFLNALCTFMNRYIKTTGMLDELIYHRLFQWILPEETTAGKIPMREEDIFNLGKIGGLFQPRTAALTSLGSIWFTPSHVVRGIERSERGLLDMEYESFMFVRVNRDDHETDINTLANAMRRTTYREQGAVPLGYVKEGTQLFDRDGSIRPESILSEPPIDGAYIEWYGLKYLHYEEFFDTVLPLSVDVYKLLFESVQRIRRRGVNIESLLEITQLLGGGYIYDLEIEQEQWWYNCYYKLDTTAVIYNRERRYVAWLNICRMKFKMFTFIDRAIVTPGGP